mmetsp:Transcript_25359/g.40020  ORF Transcript_25359/g.40020 Transcript_25359/m.40020 type:complete len:135 (+) Transcript_25359:42-446(+)
MSDSPCISTEDSKLQEARRQRPPKNKYIEDHDLRRRVKKQIIRRMQKALRELSVQCHVSVMSIWVETNPGREVNELVLRMDLLEDQKNLMKKLATEAALRYRNRLEGKYTSEVTPEINSRPHNRSEQGHQVCLT